MGKASKKKQGLEVRVAVPDEKLMSHISNAYGLVCQYRTYQKVPHEKLETWLLRLVVEGCNAIFNYHNQQLAEMEKKQKEAEEKESGEVLVSDDIKETFEKVAEEYGDTLDKLAPNDTNETNPAPEEGDSE